MSHPFSVAGSKTLGLPLARAAAGPVRGHTACSRGGNPHTNAPHIHTSIVSAIRSVCKHNLHAWTCL